MDWRAYNDPDRRLEAIGDWAVFEALSAQMGRLVSDGNLRDALVVCEELERYLRGEGWSWAPKSAQEVGP